MPDHLIGTGGIRLVILVNILSLQKVKYFLFFHLQRDIIMLSSIWQAINKFYKTL